MCHIYSPSCHSKSVWFTTSFFFFWWSIDILRNFSVFFHELEINDDLKWLPTFFILFCVPQIKICTTDWEQHEGIIALLIILFRSFMLQMSYYNHLWFVNFHFRNPKERTNSNWTFHNVYFKILDKTTSFFNHTIFIKSL